MAHKKKAVHDWKYTGSSPHNGEYWYECTVCGCSDWIASYGTQDQLIGAKVCVPIEMCPSKQGKHRCTFRKGHPGLHRGEGDSVGATWGDTEPGGSDDVHAVIYTVVHYNPTTNACLSTSIPYPYVNKEEAQELCEQLNPDNGHVRCRVGILTVLRLPGEKE